MLVQAASCVTGQEEGISIAYDKEGILVRHGGPCVVPAALQAKVGRLLEPTGMTLAWEA